MEERNVQDISFVEIETLVDAELSAEAVCPCGCGMCIVIEFEPTK